MTSSKGKEITRPSPTTNLGSDDKPLWNHVNVILVPIGGGGNRTWTCNYYHKKVTGSYSKVKAHLLRISNQGVASCKEVNDELYRAIKKEHDEVELRATQRVMNEKSRTEYISLPKGSDITQHKKRRGPLEKSFNVLERDEADKDLARAFYTAGIPFNFVRNPYFMRYFLRLANGNVAGYTPPTFNRLRTTLLAQEKSHVEVLLQPIKETWKKKGVSICSDGWSDRSRRPLINIVAASSGGPIFLDAIDSSGNIKDAEYVAKIFCEAIEQIGAHHVVQIVTDNGSNFKAAGLSIEIRYPHIFWTPCVVHCLNLALKSMCEPSEKSDHYVECKWMNDLVNEVQDIRNFIMNHGMALAIFQRHSKLTLLKMAETRFASSVIMIKRFSILKDPLEKMVMDQDWKTFKVNGKTPIEVKARGVKDLIVNDTWWDKIDYFLKLTEPIIKMLRVADKDEPILHLIYDMWDTMIEEVKSIIFEHEEKHLLSGQSQFFDVIQNILESRWNKSNTPLHCMTHSLVPKYYSENWLQGANNGVRRHAPNEDEEVSINRDKCLQRIFSNEDELRKVYIEYGLFSSGSDYFNQPHVIAARGYEDPLSWWANYGASTPLLQALAFKLLSQPASSSCCERNWSTYSTIQTVKRSKLASSRVKALVFVHSNLRLLSRKEESYTIGPSRYWDIGGDECDIEDSLGRMSSLSLDDPEIEAVIFEDDVE